MLLPVLLDFFIIHGEASWIGFFIFIYFFFFQIDLYLYCRPDMD